MSALTTSTVLVSRQAIYDRELQVAAYELLYRTPGSDNAAFFDDGDKATSQLLVNALTEIGLHSLTNDCPALVNFTRAFLVGEREIPFDQKRLVLEVLEDVPPDDEVINALIGLKESGFRIALDDFVTDDKRWPLVELADIVKLDLRAIPPEALEQEIEQLRNHSVQLLAEKVETAEEFDRCREMGFDLFQGFFLSRPRVVEGRTLRGNNLAILQLLATLQDPNVSFERAYKLIKQDVAVSLKLLRYVNSSACGLTWRVESVKQAATLLGLDRIRQVVSLIAVSSMDYKPAALIEDTLIRARMCELLAQSVDGLDSATCFTVGLFSSLDVLMDCPLETVLESLPLEADVRDAIQGHEGPMGRLIEAVIAFERGDWERLDCTILNGHLLQTGWLEAVA